MIAVQVTRAMLEYLNERQGEWVSMNDLLFAIYRGESEPDWAAGSVRVLIHLYRKRAGRGAIETRTGEVRVP